MPGLLKGWIDRVFSSGWVYGETADGKVLKKLGRLRVHLVALGAASQKTYDKHGLAMLLMRKLSTGFLIIAGLR